jgi:hypothetical protein
MRGAAGWALVGFTPNALNAAAKLVLETGTVKSPVVELSHWSACC